MDATVIGAIQINEGDLANWALPGQGVLGPGEQWIWSLE